jgi:heptosyltransferase I
LKVLIVKLSSLGDVLHTLPVVQDITIALPNAQIDWVVERSFADVVRRCQGVNKVIACELRQWRKTPFNHATKNAWRTFKAELQLEKYDAVIDLQGLTKSAAIAWLAKLSPTGKRFAMANQTDGSSYEAPTRWVADVAIRIELHIHAVQRARDLCAKALGYQIDESKQNKPHIKLTAGVFVADTAINNIAKSVVFAHGSSREDKLWPIENWIDLGRRLHAHGLGVAIAHGSDEEEQRSKSIALQIPDAQVLPRLGLDALLDVLGSSAGVVGVDSGLSHMAVALDLPHVQIYNFDTAWRTGPAVLNGFAPKAKQLSVFAQPTPSVDVVWQAWQAVNSQIKNL